MTIKLGDIAKIFGQRKDYAMTYVCANVWYNHMKCIECTAFPSFETEILFGQNGGRKRKRDSLKFA